MVIHEHNALLKHYSLLHSTTGSQTADLVSRTQVEVTLHLAAKLDKTLSPALNRLVVLRMIFKV